MQLREMHYFILILILFCFPFSCFFTPHWDYWSCTLGKQQSLNQGWCSTCAYPLGCLWSLGCIELFSQKCTEFSSHFNFSFFILVSHCFFFLVLSAARVTSLYFYKHLCVNSVFLCYHPLTLDSELNPST